MFTPKALSFLPVLLGLFFGTTACSGEGSGPRNLILISVDTLRADHLGSYGYERGTSPVLDTFAAEGTLFENVMSTASWTVPAHMSMFTGQYTRTHGIDGWKKSLPEETLTLAGFLKDKGFATVAYMNVILLNQRRSFDRGFKDYAMVPKAESATGATGRILGNAISWIKDHSDERFFLFLHFYDVHSDYDPLPRYRKDFVRLYNGDVTGETSQLRAFRRGTGTIEWRNPDVRHLIDLYDAGIRQFDDQVSVLFEFLDASGLADETLLMLTSDHGEEFLDHGGILHGRTLFQELVHVPLIIRGPGIPVGQRITANASLIDLMPTALSILGFEPPAQCEGVDLSASWRLGETFEDRVVFSEADKWLAQEPGNYRRAARRGKFKLLYDHATGERTVYDLSSDPRELSADSAEDSALLKALWGELEAFMEGKQVVEEGFELTEEEMQELEDLGYF